MFPLLMFNVAPLNPRVRVWTGALNVNDCACSPADSVMSIVPGGGGGLGKMTGSLLVGCVLSAQLLLVDHRLLPELLSHVSAAAKGVTPSAAARTVATRAKIRVAYRRRFRNRLYIVI